MSCLFYGGPVKLAGSTRVVISCLVLFRPSLKSQMSSFLLKCQNLFLRCILLRSVLFCRLLYFIVLLNTVLFVYSFLFPLIFLLYFISFLFPWWKLNEASPSATVLICTKLCPLLKAYLCCSTLWALSCLVFLLVTLLVLTDSQVKCTLRAACYLCVCLLHLLWRHFNSFDFRLRF